MRNQNVRLGSDDLFNALDWPRSDPPQVKRLSPDLIEWLASGSWPQPGVSQNLLREALTQAALSRTSSIMISHSDGRSARSDDGASLTEDEDLRLAEQFIADTILQRTHSQPEDLLVAFTHFPALQAPLAELHDAVRAHLIETDSLRIAVEPAYHRLTVRLTLPALDHLAVFAFLDLLESYVEQIEQIARINEAVRAVWAKQAPLIARTI